MTKNDELYHYGVPGMKWGQKRASAKLEKVSNRAKKRGWSDDATEVAKIKTKKVKQMSNKELTTVNNRKTLERNYSQLNPNTLKKGLAIAGATAAALGTMAALYKHGKTIISGGKKLTQKVVDRYSNVKASRASNAFWKDMRNMPSMGNDFGDLLK